MKYLHLKQIVQKEIDMLEENAGWFGKGPDPECKVLKNKLDRFKQKLIKQFDLKPSEFSKLDTIEVGEPRIFYRLINTKNKNQLTD